MLAVRARRDPGPYVRLIEFLMEHSHTFTAAVFACGDPTVLNCLLTHPAADVGNVADQFIYGCAKGHIKRAARHSVTRLLDLCLAARVSPAKIAELVAHARKVTSDAGRACLETLKDSVLRRLARSDAGDAVYSIHLLVHLFDRVGVTYISTNDRCVALYTHSEEGSVRAVAQVCGVRVLGRGGSVG